jgi:hypothetical protein
MVNNNPSTRPAKKCVRGKCLGSVCLCKSGTCQERRLTGFPIEGSETLRKLKNKQFQAFFGAARTPWLYINFAYHLSGLSLIAYYHATPDDRVFL